MSLSIISFLMLLFAIVNADNDANTTKNTITIHNNCDAVLNIKLYDLIYITGDDHDKDDYTYVKPEFGIIKIAQGVSEINVTQDVESLMYASIDVYDKNGVSLPLLSTSDIYSVVIDESMATKKFYAYTDYEELWLCVPNVDVEVIPIDMTRVIQIQNDCDYDVYIGQSVYSYDLNHQIEMICKPRKRLVQGGVFELQIDDAPFINFFSAYDSYKNTNVNVFFEKFVSMGMPINKIIETSNPLIGCDDYISRNEIFYFFYKHYIIQKAILCFKPPNGN